MVDPIRPAGGLPSVQPSSRPAKVAPSSGPSFVDLLEKAVKAADPRIERVRRFASDTLHAEAVDVRVMEVYDELSADEALFEVQTSKGDCQVILSRSGGLSLVEGP